MPICTREGLDKKVKSPEKFNDHEEVFYCETTKEIFRNYDDYFQRVMLINSTIWKCSETGRENLTYAEALKSERKARKKLKSFKEALKAPTLIIVDKICQSSIKPLTKTTYAFLKDRYFVDELIVYHKNSSRIDCKIVEIIKPSKRPENGVYDPATVKYKIQKIKKPNDVLVVQNTNLRRHKTEFTSDNLRMFIKLNTTIVDCLYKPKPDVYKKLVTDKKLTFEKLFIGNLPDWKPSKTIVKKAETQKKQLSMSQYVVTQNGEKKGQTKNLEKTVKDEENAKSLKEEMERLHREKMERQAEMEKKRLERLALLDAEVQIFFKKCDDLERVDQRVLPNYHPVKTLVPIEQFGDFLMIQEFLHSFSPILAAYDVFKSSNINFHQMCRALLVKEVAGPLSDILQVLLSTIFSLQIEEEDECSVEYIKGKLPANTEPWITASDAAYAQIHTRRYYSSKMQELPMDAQTLTEILRLHLLASGARTDERSERWRYQYRGGYSRKEDPGLLLRKHHPHIVRSLKMLTVYELPIDDILKIIHCLMDQILTHYGTINLLDERLEALYRARIELRQVISQENKRIMNLTNLRKKTMGEFHLAIMDCNNDEELKKKVQSDLNKKLDTITAQDERGKKDFQIQMERVQATMFDHMVYLGTDRAYRKYFIFESISGIFIEHPKVCDDVCLENPPKNCFELALCDKKKFTVRTIISRRMKLANKENHSSKNKSTPDVIVIDPENDKENLLEQQINGKVTPVPTANNAIKLPEENNEKSAYELYMCTGDPKHCIVHDENNPDRQLWSYIHTEEELNALIESLNAFGIHESELKMQLSSLKDLILNHIKLCPTDLISIDETEPREKHIEKVIAKTQSKYHKSNFGFPLEMDLTNVMYKTLVDRVLQFEEEITSGNLGKIKVKDLDTWRTDLFEGRYDSQCGELIYGVQETDITKYRNKFKDPSEGSCIDPLEDDDEANKKIKPEEEDIEMKDVSGVAADDADDSPEIKEIKKNAKALSSALLQIAQGVEQKFLKEPFGVKNELKDKQEMQTKLTSARLKYRFWEESLMNTTNYSQIFLHLNVFSDSVKWNKSVNESRCLVCRKRSDPENLLLCDECNAGTHMYCCKPKLKKVPEGNWYCKNCEPKMEKINGKPGGTKKRPRKIFNFNADEEDNNEEEEKEVKKNSDSNESDEDFNPKKKSKQTKQPKTKKRRIRALSPDDFSHQYEDTEPEEEQEDNEETEEQANIKKEETKEPESESESGNEEESVEENSESNNVVSCSVCTGVDCELCCSTCELSFHLECISLRRAPRGNWLCKKCKAKQDKKRKAEALDTASSDSEDEQVVKRSRRFKDQKSTNIINNKNNNNSRRSRRTNDYLPLNSVILYSLLEEIMKHEDAWPFLRPVSLHEVPDYHEIIKYPMDFAKVKSKLNMGNYSVTEEALNDIQLVFRNCDTYNTEGNDIYNAGASLEAFVIKRCKDLNLPFKPSDMNTETTTTETTM